MVEGLLLPVSLPETQDLYHVLLQRPLSPPPAGCLSPPLDDSSDCTEHLQLSSQEKTLSWAEVRQPVPPRDQAPKINNSINPPRPFTNTGACRL